MLTSKFFDTVRPMFPGGVLTDAQVSGLMLLHGCWQKWGLSDRIDLEGYFLATATWETGYTMQPVKETQFGPKVPTDAQVKERLTKAWKAGKLPWVKKDYWSDGWFGRGYAQLTHRENYGGRIRELVKEAFNVDLLVDRDAALRPDVAAFILIKGLLLGLFTGVAIQSYLDGKDEGRDEDFNELVRARKAVNGTDKAEKIATIATTYTQALYPNRVEPLRPVQAPLQEPAPAPTFPHTKVLLAVGLVGIMLAAIYFAPMLF